MQDILAVSIIIMFWFIGQGNCIMLLRTPSVGKAEIRLFSIRVTMGKIKIHLLLGREVILKKIIPYTKCVFCYCVNLLPLVALVLKFSKVVLAY
jgi:hypothetical protein